jgi:hypothetical protein
MSYVTKRFNQVSFWVASLIVKLKEIKTRTAMLERMIDIAQHCKKLYNFNTAFAIMAGIKSVSVHRLKKTWESINEDCRVTYNEICELMSPDKSYKVYRDYLAKYVRNRFYILYIFKGGWTLCSILRSVDVRSDIH